MASRVFSLSRRLKVLCIAALLSVATLTTTGHFLASRALRRVERDARLVNIAGRQRMLSQKIAKCALLLGQKPPQAPAQTRRELREALALWKRSRRALLVGDALLGVPQPVSPLARQLLERSAPHFEAMSAAATRLLELAAAPSAARGAAPVRAQIGVILRHEGPYLRQMNQTVFQIDEQVEQQLREVRLQHVAFVLLTLTVLLLEGLCLFRPVTAQVSATLQNLSASEARQRALLEAMPDALLLFDDGGHLIEARPAGADALAAPLSVQLNVHFAPHLKAALAAGGQTFERTFELRDGEAGRDYEARLVLLRGQETRGALALVRDITARKESERFQDELISTVAHELRTPLTSIRGALGLLNGNVAGELPPRAASLVGVALCNCERLTRLVNDILELERIQSGQIELHLAEIALDAAVLRAVEANRAIAGEFGVQYKLDLQGCGSVRGDGERLAQIFAHLLLNAAKRSPRGADVGVQTARRCDATGCWMRVCIADRGPGIAPELRDQIFGRFAPSDGSDARATQGSGFGLSIARALTETLDGRIGFDSQPGQGTTFWVEWREELD